MVSHTNVLRHASSGYCQRFHWILHHTRFEMSEPSVDKWHNACVDLVFQQFEQHDARDDMNWRLFERILLSGRRTVCFVVFGFSRKCAELKRFWSLGFLGW